MKNRRIHRIIHTEVIQMAAKDTRSEAWDIVDQYSRKSLDELLSGARLVKDKYTIIDRCGDLYSAISAEESVMGRAGIYPEIIGFDITGGSKDLRGFHTVLKTREDQYIARLGVSYFLIDSDGRLLSEGGHKLIRQGERIFTGYGADLHENSGSLAADNACMVGDTFRWCRRDGKKLIELEGSRRSAGLSSNLQEIGYELYARKR